MDGENSKITLYPSNWLYNAGVVGFLRVLEEKVGQNVEEFLKDDGGVEIDVCIFSKLGNKSQDLYFSKEKVSSIVGKSSLYRNYLQGRWKGAFNKFIKLLAKSTRTGNCDICGVGYYIPDNAIDLQNNDLENLIKFRNGIRNFDIRMNALLAPSQEFPNSFWNNYTTSIVCDLCGYILVHHHLALIKLSDNSEIFINAPSFKLMWYLNRYSSIYTKEKTKTVREILGISLIEMSSKLYIQLGKWEKMNIEIVSKYKEDKIKIDFFSLPGEIVNLLTNKEIATMLNQIGEFRILNMVLDAKFKEILNFVERVMRISLKNVNERSKSEKKFIDENINLKRNKRSLMEFCHKLLKLYSLIETEIKKEVI